VVGASSPSRQIGLLQGQEREESTYWGAVALQRRGLDP